MNVEIYPLTFNFHVINGESEENSLQIRNNSNARVAFQIESDCPEIIYLSSCSGFLDPSSKVDIVVSIYSSTSRQPTESVVRIFYVSSDALTVEESFDLADDSSIHHKDIGLAISYNSDTTASVSSPLHSSLLEADVVGSNPSENDLYNFDYMSLESPNKDTNQNNPDFAGKSKSIAASIPLSDSEDALKKVHSEALSYIRTHSPKPSRTFEVKNSLEGRILDLMVKNVSRDDPLTPTEIEVGVSLAIG